MFKCEMDCEWRNGHVGRKDLKPYPSFLCQSQHSLSLCKDSHFYVNQLPPKRSSGFYMHPPLQAWKPLRSPCFCQLSITLLRSNIMLHSAVIKNSFFGAHLPRFESQPHNLLALGLSVPPLPYL